ncbi:hypothetical protein [Bradyrhizobium sp.]|uniref:hypothetical protein n=1 Tax=Bradyrhizobium sp. TaxID=376 RepID=UPI0025B8182D|nr:hypothetical protein [Bradyrhizobium sp.]
MSIQTWQETLINSQVDGPALANSVTATSLLNVHEKWGMAQSWAQIGRVLRLTACGRVSNIVTAPGTLTLSCRIGAITIANGGAMALNVVAKTNVPWFLDWRLTCRAIGAAGNFMHQGTWISESVIGAPLPTAGGAGIHLLPNAAPAVGTNFDTSVPATFDLFAQWSVANAGNSIQVHQYKLESLI